MKYPRLLSSGENNKVIAISETEVGKFFVGDNEEMREFEEYFLNR